LRTDRIDLYYLHAPDPQIPLSESAEAMGKLLESGKIRSVGVSNFNPHQLTEFHTVCPISAFQPHYNMLQREIESSLLPWCVAHQVAVIVYWPLMKGLLAGKLARSHKFDSKDGRLKYPMFNGVEWEKNQDFLDRLRPIAAECGSSIAQLVLNWTIQRPGITAALCGAKRPDQIRDNAAALTWTLTVEQIARIDQAIADRGEVVSRSAV
jgi:aryl-alcohol dehydrogenase-like predicted oxidoreductase